MARIGPLSDDLQPILVSSPDAYPHTTDSPVRYRPVTLDGLLLGYLWVSVTGDAVDFAPREAAGILGSNAGVSWVMRLRRSKAEGLAPVQAYEHWVGRPSEIIDKNPTGAVDPGAEERQIESLGALQELADADGGPPMYRETATNLRFYAAKVQGCLVGGAIGDALGYPVEFDSLDTIRRRFGENGITGFVPYGDRPGLISDDTQMTLFTCEGLITAAVASDDASADPTPHVYRSYLRWLKTQGSDGSPASAPSWLSRQEWLYSSRAPGNACTSGLAFGAMGTRDAPKNPESKGCGTVMRAAPFGLRTKTSREAFDQAIDSAVLTHGHPSGYLAAGALAAIVRAVRENAPLERGIEEALVLLRYRPGHEEVTAALKAAWEAATAGPPSPEIVESLGGGWTAEEALAIAVYAALCYREPEQTRDALLLAVNHSGDSDSTGAICGNILGAWHGLNALPQDLAAAVEGRATIDQVAADLAWVNWGKWRRSFPDRLADLTTSYPASDDPVPAATFPGRTESSIQYLPVILGTVPLGYLWASTANDAASFVCLGGIDQAEVQSRKAGTAWLERLRQSKAEGKTPLQALRYWTFEPEDPVAGAVPPGTEVQELSSLAELQALAAPKGMDVMSPQEITELRWYQDHVQGCLLGGATGDALGYPVESRSLDEIRSEHGPDGVTGFGPEDTPVRVAGSTQLTLFTCEGLITTAIADDSAYADMEPGHANQHWADPAPRVHQSYLRWLETQRTTEPSYPTPSHLPAQPWLYERRTRDDACESALSDPGMGTWASPRNPGAKGSGAVVRSAPFGLHPWKDITGIFKEAQDSALLTHGHPTAYLAAAAFAIIIRTLIGRESLPVGVDHAIQVLQGTTEHEKVTTALAVARETAASGPPSAQIVESLGDGWTADEALAIGVYAALAHPAPEQGRDALLLSVNHSGNSSATASICGNLIGAWHGTAAIPDDLGGKLEGRSTIMSVASDLSMVTWPSWRRYIPGIDAFQISERYPAE